jgi:hypothetical protein
VTTSVTDFTARLGRGSNNRCGSPPTPARTSPRGLVGIGECLVPHALLSKLQNSINALDGIYDFLSGSHDGSCSDFLPAFSFTIVSAAFRLSCDRIPSVGPSTMVVRLPPPRRSLTHIRMKMPMRTMRRTRANNNVRMSFTIYTYSVDYDALLLDSSCHKPQLPALLMHLVNECKA